MFAAAKTGSSFGEFLRVIYGLLEKGLKKLF